jgi:NTP pyrophosphatase (non-canonical NTP hydrolase)
MITQKEINDNAKAHGWWEESRTFPELIALCHSELSEALEDYRNGKLPDETFYECKSPEQCEHYTSNGKCTAERTCLYKKPCGIPSELADVVIRIMDMCEHYGIDLDDTIEDKHFFNISRPFKHGNKVL